MKQSNYAEFSDPRLVAIYDAVCPIDGYANFYIERARSLKAKTVIDIGCGTGLLSHELARHGHSVIGVEPAPAMLEQARYKYGNEALWLVGSTEALRMDMQADLAIMTGHVAQFFLEETDWKKALQDIHQALRPGGHLIFESRNPQIKPFTDWPTQHKPGTVNTPLGLVWWWPEDMQFTNGYARYDLNYLLTKTNELILSANKLRFRTQEELAQSLEDAGFTVEHIYGDWSGGSAEADSLEMIFVAKRPS